MINLTDDPGMFRTAIDHMVSLWCLARNVSPGEEVTVSAEETDDVLTLIIGVGEDASARVVADRGDGELPPLRELTDLSGSMPFGVLVISGRPDQESGPDAPDAAPGPDDRSFWPADVAWTGNGDPR